MSSDSNGEEDMDSTPLWYTHTDVAGLAAPPPLPPPTFIGVNGNGIIPAPAPAPSTAAAAVAAAPILPVYDDNVYDSEDDVDVTQDNYERNLNIIGFFKYWERCSGSERFQEKVQRAARYLASSVRETYITRQDIENGKFLSEQGIPWKEMGTTPAIAKEFRRHSYNNYVNTPLSDDGRSMRLPNHEYFYRFNKFVGLAAPKLTHFQLRHLVGATDSTHVYYGGNWSIMLTNLNEKAPKPFIAIPSEGSPVWTHGRKQFTSVAAANGVVVGGGFFGEYAYKAESIDQDDYIPPSSPTVTNHQEGLVVGAEVSDGIINQVHLYTPRSTSNPTAVFCTNNELVRYLDCNSNTFIKDHRYEFPINGCATSPDQKLRVLVGDHPKPMVTEVESGDVIARLDGHGDNCFASAWAEDGVTFATGSQDKTVFIWDARKWNQSVHEINTEMAAPRSLTFSRLGSGRRHLIIAEAADRIHVVDARDYKSEHSLDMLGEIGGVATSPDSSHLFVANTDEHFGGILVYDRYNLGLSHKSRIRSEDHSVRTKNRAPRNDTTRKPIDWLEEGDSWDYGSLRRNWQDPRRFGPDDDQTDVPAWMF